MAFLGNGLDDQLGQLCGGRDGRFLALSHDSPRNPPRCWLLAIFKDKVSQFPFAQTIDELGRRLSLTAIHAHVERWSRSLSRLLETKTEASLWRVKLE